MSGKHNKPHPQRGVSNYPDRLAARGLSHAPALIPLETLRARQQRRYDQTESPWPDGFIPVKESHLEQINATYGGF